MKTKLTSLFCAAVMSMALLTGCGGSTVTDPGTSAANEPEKVTPTFMYFVSGGDEDFDAANEVFEELEKEYSDEVNFNLINIDENTDALSNFPLVQGNTPMLIMLNTSNDISSLSPKTTDKSELKAIIDEALK